MKNQYHIILQLIVFCLLLMSCILLVLKNEGKPIKYTIFIKKIDNGYLDTIKAIGRKDQKIQLVKNDSIVELVDTGNGYFETRRKNNELIYNYFSYDKKNHLMFASGTEFYDIPIGIFRRYNEKGELTEEVNRDKNFSFSVYDLIKKIKVTHQIDLNKTTKFQNVSRTFDKSLDGYIYMITYKNDEKEQSKYIAVDGQTGEIISEGILKINMR